MEITRSTVSREWPRIALGSGATEAAKWLGVAIMVADHVNTYLFNGTITGIYPIGRIAAPLFVFVLAYNLARPGAMERGVYGRVMARLLCFGLVASIPYIAIGGPIYGIWPLNILFTLLAITASIYCIERGGRLGLAAGACMVVVGGGVAAYWWPAVTLGVAVWWYCRQPGVMPAAAILAAWFAFGWVNGNQWALAAIPVLGLLSLIDARIPRIRWFFYAFYPLHLAAIWLIRIPMANAGYLFFT